MSTNFTVVGGDLRIIKLAKMLAEDGNKVYTYGVEKAEELKKNKNIKKKQYQILLFNNYSPAATPVISPFAPGKST